MSAGIAALAICTARSGVEVFANRVANGSCQIDHLIAHNCTDPPRPAPLPIVECDQLHVFVPSRHAAS